MRSDIPEGSDTFETRSRRQGCIADEESAWLASLPALERLGRGGGGDGLSAKLYLRAATFARLPRLDKGALAERAGE